MRTTEQLSKHRGIVRLKHLASVVLMLVAIPLIASCGGGDQGNSGGKAQDGGKGGEKAQDGGGGKGGGTGGNKKPQITDLRVIFSSPDKKALNNKRARLKGMEVRSVVSDRAFLVGENDAEQLLVLNVGDGVGVKEKQEVLVAGRLSVPSPELEKRFSLSPEEVSAIEEQGIFLRAPQVKPQ